MREHDPRSEETIFSTALRYREAVDLVAVRRAQAGFKPPGQLEGLPGGLKARDMTAWGEALSPRSGLVKKILSALKARDIGLK